MRRNWLFPLLLAAFAQFAVAGNVEIVGTRVHIPVSVNGAAAKTFILDTGASRSPVDPEYAKSLGLIAKGTAHTHGAGGGVTVGLARDVTVTLGGFSQTLKSSPMTPLTAISLRIGQPVSGIIGHDVMSRYVTEIDYANETVVFHPKSFSPPRDAVRLPMRMNGALPLVDVRLTMPDGREVAGRFLVDTGAGLAFVVTRAFAEKQKIDVDGAIEMSAGLGVGGATHDRMGRLPRVAVGGFTFERPIVSLSRDTKGVLSSSGFDGLIGGALLRRFTMYVDYGRKQFALVPNATIGDPFEIDMSGLQLASRDTAFDAVLVNDVLPVSPAADAGIRAGDELRAIDGKRILPRDFDDIRQAFREPGRRFELTIVRDGVEMTIPLVTKRLL